jgi:hypothetical protein
MKFLPHRAPQKIPRDGAPGDWWPAGPQESHRRFHQKGLSFSGRRTRKSQPLWPGSLSVEGGAPGGVFGVLKHMLYLILRHARDG